MTEATARSPIKRTQIEAVVIRADGTRIPLGVVADSKWKLLGRFDPRKILADRRIRQLNRRHGS